jgi:hypothetical protein
VHDAVCWRAEIVGVVACGTILERTTVAAVVVLGIEAAELEAVRAIDDAMTTDATCSRKLSTSHADTDASWSATAIECTRSMAPRAERSRRSVRSESSR